MKIYKPKRHYPIFSNVEVYLMEMGRHIIELEKRFSNYSKTTNDIKNE